MARSMRIPILLALVVALLTTLTVATHIPSKTSPSDKAIYQARQFNPRLPKQSKKRQEKGSSCPAAPLPTLGCDGCTTCVDSGGVRTCASPSSDPQSCGTCASDKIACAAGPSQVATCTTGTCGVVCDAANGFSGPSDACFDVSSASHLTCPLITALSGYQLSDHRVGTSAVNSAWNYVDCFYSQTDGKGNYLSSNQLACHYNAGSGQLTEEDLNRITTPLGTNCPSMIPKSSTTSGTLCGTTVFQCARSLVFKGATSTIINAEARIFHTADSTASTNYFICLYSSGRSCYFDPKTRQVTSAYLRGDNSFTVASCPPLVEGYTAYCLE